MSGYEARAFYYVAFAIAAPDMLPHLGLPFDGAFANAKAVHERGKK